MIIHIMFGAKRFLLAIVAALLIVPTLPAFIPHTSATTLQEKIIYKGFSTSNQIDFHQAIVSINPDGSNRKVIYESPSNLRLDIAKTSPDGSKIVFSQLFYAGLREQSDIYVVNADGTGLVDLTLDPIASNHRDDTSPDWSPDGARIAYSVPVRGADSQPSTNWGVNPGIYIMDADGSNSHLAIPADTTEVPFIASPSWSPDGTKIAFTTTRPNETGSSQSTIGISNIDGSDISILANSADGSHPSWSPDGTRIAFDSGIAGSNPSISTINVDGTNRVDLVSGGGQPAWSPDSSKLVYVGVSPTSSGRTLGIVDSTSGTPQFIYNDPYIVGVPFWGRLLVSNEAPSIDALPAKTLNEGDGYSDTGSFTDPDSSSWTATVDYGDGLGVQPLTLSGTNFNLSHTYKDNGAYTVTINVTDNGNLTGTQTTTVTVNNVGPSVGNISTIPSDPTPINTAFNASANFTDAGVLDTHTASWNWGDGNTSAGTVTESNGSGSVTGNHAYTAAGVYSVTLTIADNNGGVGTSNYNYVVVYNPSNNAFFNGSGKYDSLAGWYSTNPIATGQVKFGVNARYNNNVLNAQAKMNFKNANLDFNSTSCQWLVVNGANGQLKCTGTINGSGNYTILITAIDGSQANTTDKVRIKLTNNANNSVVYDAQTGDPDTTVPTTVSTGGSINVHN
jgi:hypothetical protein